MLAPAGTPVTFAVPWETEHSKRKFCSTYLSKLQLLVTSLGQIVTLIAEFDIVVGLVGPPSIYAKDACRVGQWDSLQLLSIWTAAYSTGSDVPEFDNTCLRCASPACMTVRDSLFCIELCQKMQHVVSKETKREHAFGTLYEASDKREEHC